MTRTHGYTKVGVKNKTYTTWVSMMDRCFCENNKKYPRYGGRGITVCERWLGTNGFMNFLADMGERPEGTTIDRINNNGIYEPGNCRWATPSEQGDNRSTTVIVEFNGKAMSLTAWAKLYGVPRARFYERYRKGWPLDAVFDVAINSTRRKFPIENRKIKPQKERCLNNHDVSNWVETKRDGKPMRKCKLCSAERERARRMRLKQLSMERTVLPPRA